MEIHKNWHEEKCTEEIHNPIRETEEEEEEEEEEETLSLCDLPVVVDNPTRDRADQSQPCSEEEFDFSSWRRRSNSVPREEMCAADDVFFKGQILPLRFSLSSSSGGSRPGFHRSESMDHASISRLTSRSSSYNSTTSSCSAPAADSNPARIRNNFHTHPSPKPQIRPSKTRNPNPRTQKSSSTLWDFLKLGLIRAPEIELTNNNNRTISVSRNSSWSSNSSGNNMISNSVQTKRRSTVGLFGGCNCSADAAVRNDAVLIKSCGGGGKRYQNIDDVEEKVMMIKKDTEKEKMKRRGKQVLSRRRTSDWLRDLSHVTYGDH